ncbi:MAG: acetyl-coenzyme A synthetase N-terminal domain-containing protein, partial [Desulfotignum sp.]
MPEKLWEPSEEQIRSTNMYRFMTIVNEKFNKNFTDYTRLWEWSVENLEDFWALAWDFLDIKASVPYEKVIQDKDKMPGAKFFVGSKLNFAENLLRFRDDRTALVFRGEDAVRRTLTYNQLYDEVAKTAASLKAMGIKAGDRVVGFV